MWESRVAPLSGVLFAVLLIAGFLVTANTEFMPPQDDVVAYYQSQPLRIMTGAYLGLLAAFALLWFSGSAYSALRGHDDDQGRLSLIAFGGGAIASTLLVGGHVATIAAAERVRVVGTVDTGAAAALFDLSGVAVGNGVPIGMAALIGATAIVHSRSGRFPRWAIVVSALIALGLVSPFGWIVLGLAILWIAGIGVWMYRDNAAQSLAEVA